MNNYNYCKNRLKSWKRLLNSYLNIEIDSTINWTDENENFYNWKRCLETWNCVNSLIKIMNKIGTIK